MDERLRKLWSRVAAHLRAALAGIELSDSHRELAEEFLDHNELGLAFQMIVYSLNEAGGTVEQDVRRHLAAAAVEMGLEQDPDWRRLEASSE